MTSQTMGNIGNRNDRRTSGGGLIYLNLEALVIRGRSPEPTLLVNGQPMKDTSKDTEDKMAGSGG